MKTVSSILLVCSLIIIGATQKSQAQCSAGYSQIIVKIIPDNYPNETSWDIKDAANTIIASGTISNDTLCWLAGNLLHFTIYDSYGDGMCCGWGNGSYNVYIDGNLVASGGEFTFSETTFFNYPPGAISATLINAYQQLMDHCNNITELSPVQINSLADSINQYHLYLADTLPVISAAFDLINCYETNPCPVFLNAHTTGGFPNAPGALDGFEYDRAIFVIQQELFEVLYTKENIAKYSTFLNGRKYLTSNYFPGVCPLPVDSSQVYLATVNASMPADWGKPTAWSTTPARRPTGYYLAPGSIGKVKVPNIMVNAGYKILVGAHPHKNSNMNPILRFFEISNTYEITDSVTLIANTFGGGIYIITPYQASAGLQQIKLTNVVPAPFFSAKSYEATTLSEWQNVQRLNPAPWADFESEKFMMQVPTSFIYNYSDPVTLMTDWDARMDVVSTLLGYPLVRNNQVLYVMLDASGMGYGGYGIGNPQINNIYSPYDVQNGNSQMWFLVPGAAHMWESEFHELGHAQLMEKFPGESEAIVNLLSAAIFNELYGIDIDSAFGWSFNNEYWRTRDQSAINWMVTHNFRAGNPMDISNTTKDEVRYQHRGYGKYVEIAALFGWQVLENYYHQVNLDYINGVPPGPLGEIDDRILKLSKAAGADLRPLIHFWGVHPQDSAALAQAINNNNLQPSPLIFNRLMHYKSIIPMDNAQFNQHALVFFNGPVPPGGNPDYGNGWYNVWLPLYNNSHGDSAVVALQKIIDTYFPDGCAYVICGSHVINDSLGNNNGMVDYNDPILLSLTMKNAGTVAASNVMVTLSCADAYITINDATENFGTIAANDSVTIPFGFKFTEAGNIPDNHMVSFDVVASDGTNSWPTTINLIAHAPVFQVGSMTISDPAGNNNGRLDPGETAEVTITATNTGSSAASNSIAMLNSSNGFVIINTPQVDLGNVIPGVPVTATFSLTVDASAPFGSTADLNYSVVSGQYSAVKTFSVKIGLVVEDFESGGFTHFPWIQGGNQPWTITDVSPFEGTYSAKSGTITHNQKSDLSQQMTVTVADSISFYLKTSSESGYDYLKFFIDATMAGQWAGETAWTKATFPVSAGSHNFAWEYMKDGSVSSGSDCVWIDYIVFPATAPMAASVTGAVTYANTANSALAGLTINLKNSGGTTVGTTTTIAAGNYTFGAVSPGNYTLQVTTTKPWGGVSAADALLFRKHIANISLLTGIFLASGDVNASGSLTAADVLLIKKRIGAITNSFTVGDWLFNNMPFTVIGSSVTQNFNGITYGDANGSYIPAGNKSQEVHQQGILALASSCSTNKGVTIPVNISDIRNMGSFQFTIQYNPGKMTLGDISDWYTEIDEVVIGQPDPGLITFVWTADSKGISIDDGVLCNLNFTTLLPDEISVAFTEAPTQIEFADYDGNIFQPALLKNNSCENVSGESNLYVYPNPGNGIFYLRMEKYPQGILNISVINALGRIVYDEKGVEAAEVLHRILDLSGLLNGIYILSIESDLEIIQKKLILNK